MDSDVSAVIYKNMIYVKGSYKKFYSDEFIPVDTIFSVKKVKILGGEIFCFSMDDRLYHLDYFSRVFKLRPILEQTRSKDVAYENDIIYIITNGGILSVLIGGLYDDHMLMAGKSQRQLPFTRLTKKARFNQVHYSNNNLLAIDESGNLWGNKSSYDNFFSEYQLQDEFRVVYDKVETNILQFTQKIKFRKLSLKNNSLALIDDQGDMYIAGQSLLVRQVENENIRLTKLNFDKLKFSSVSNGDYRTALIDSYNNLWLTELNYRGQHKILHIVSQGVDQIASELFDVLARKIEGTVSTNSYGETVNFDQRADMIFNQL